MRDVDSNNWYSQKLASGYARPKMRKRGNCLRTSLARGGIEDAVCSSCMAEAAVRISSLIQSSHDQFRPAACPVPCSIPSSVSSGVERVVLNVVKSCGRADRPEEVRAVNSSSTMLRWPAQSGDARGEGMTEGKPDLVPQPLLAHPAGLPMRGRLTDEQRAELLRELGVGQTPSPEQVRADIEQEWLLPSKDGRKELAAAEWAM
jgi:hypothetical protein